ncbi:hypothetical protein FOZ63_014785 [Perkinsus olseni]|uniref:Uncharacterized protein n=1 Tax=Perkinsus olseni TaxID=32597 RepID=A0A7J6RDK3_PEROL|nr:hypothetical protein FOZ63_014785 [Perkinsus olseni]
MRIIIKHFTLRAAAIILSTLPIGLATGAMGLFSGFPPLEKADPSWCYFTNSNMREDRKSLWIIVKPDYALQTLYIICPKTSQWDTFQADL